MTMHRLSPLVVSVVGSSVILIINETPVPLNAFVQSVIKKVILRIIDTLKRGDEKLKQIDVIIKPEDNDGQEE